VSESLQLLHRAIQAYDPAEVESVVVRLAQGARREHTPIEQLIVDLKNAVNALPIAVLRDRARNELRDSIVRLAIAAYYDGSYSPAPRYTSEHHQSH
jgi:hypothetical protein